MRKQGTAKSTGLTDLQELRQLRDENAWLKRLVAHPTLDEHILGKSSERSSGASEPSRALAGTCVCIGAPCRRHSARTDDRA